MIVHIYGQWDEVFHLPAVAKEPWHITPASSRWPQLCTPRGLCQQDSKSISFPTQRTLSRTILTVLLALPKPARDTAMAAMNRNWVANIKMHTIKFLNVVSLTGIKRKENQYSNFSFLGSIFYWSMLWPLVNIWRKNTFEFYLYQCQESWLIPYFFSTYLSLVIVVAGIPQLHQVSPTNHHTQFPTHYRHKSLPFLQKVFVLPQVSRFPDCILKNTIWWLYGAKDPVWIKVLAPN